MHLSTLSEWLTWIASIHTKEIELGLDRVKKVGAKLRVLTFPCPLILVGGTNGKGSTVAGLEAIYRAAGFKTGAFTSPILFKHNEQVRINGEEASDQAFCAAFEKIDAARGDIALTPFEFCTLAALLIFQQYKLDVIILEVGLGGRLDAVNIVEPSVAIVTSIDIDHTDWLGDTREVIALEKAGIFRAEKPAVCGDFHPPQSLLNYAAQLNTPLFCQGVDFNYQDDATTWTWVAKTVRYADLPRNSLLTQNMSTVLMAITLLQDGLPVTRKAIEEGLTHIELHGRIEIIPGPITEIYDVSHNPAAIALLASRLKTLPLQGKTHAVFSMLADKDKVESIKNIAACVDKWYIAPLQTARATESAQLKEAFQQANVTEVSFFETVVKAYQEAKKTAVAGDRILVFGSFHTVACVYLNRTK